jgi:hypothetical protein
MGTRTLPFVKNPALNMPLAFSPDTVHVMVSYIENRDSEKYALPFAFFYYYISFSILLMLSKKRK